jgi:hypothetical protein
VVQNCKDQNKAETIAVHDKLHEISNPKSMTNQGRDITRGI